MRASATPTQPEIVLPLRVQHRHEMNCQIVHDSIHRRSGWTTTYLLRAGEATAGFGSMVSGGPWTGTPTIFEFYVLPAHRHRTFDLFDALLEASGARLMVAQSNDALLTAMFHSHAQDVRADKIVFQPGNETMLPANGATLHQVTPDAEVRLAIAQRQGGPEWRLEIDGATAGTGGILFHYNEPFGDIYMEVGEPFRRRGYGAYLVQELRRIAYELGSIPGARCSTDNIASRKTLQKAGFVPCAHILNGSIPIP